MTARCEAARHRGGAHHLVEEVVEGNLCGRDDQRLVQVGEGLQVCAAVHHEHCGNHVRQLVHLRRHATTQHPHMPHSVRTSNRWCLATESTVDVLPISRSAMRAPRQAVTSGSAVVRQRAKRRCHQLTCKWQGWSLISHCGTCEKRAQKALLI